MLPDGRVLIMGSSPRSFARFCTSRAQTVASIHKSDAEFLTGLDFWRVFCGIAIRRKPEECKCRLTGESELAHRLQSQSQIEPRLLRSGGGTNRRTQARPIAGQPVPGGAEGRTRCRPSARTVAGHNWAAITLGGHHNWAVITTGRSMAKKCMAEKLSGCPIDRAFPVPKYRMTPSSTVLFPPKSLS